MYQAIITNVSEVDASGRIEVTYSVQSNGKDVYTNLLASGMTTDIQDLIKEAASDLVNQVKEAAKIKVGDVIQIE